MQNKRLAPVSRTGSEGVAWHRIAAERQASEGDRGEWQTAAECEPEGMVAMLRCAVTKRDFKRIKFKAHHACIVQALEWNDVEVEQTG